LDAGLSEIARFLSLRAPFQSLALEDLSEMVVHTELEFYAAGAVILSEEWGPVTFLRVIHSGAVDIVHDGKLLDLLGQGDTFGHDAMLSGLPPGFEARAAEDTLCYRIPAAAARPILDRARSHELAVGAHEPANQPVANLIRSPTVRCSAQATIADVAERMTAAGVDAAIVELGDGHFGILTDRDLRTRVVVGGVPASDAVSTVMTAPAFTVAPDRLGGEVMFELLERGIQHAPVVTDSGVLVGVVDETDLLASRPRSWFGLRRSIARAQSVAALAQAAARVSEIVVELHGANVRALDLARVRSALIDALTVRALELASVATALPPDGLVWVAVGTHARRELTPGSTAVGALICSDPPPPGWIEAAAAALEACGLPADVTIRTAAEWQESEPTDVLATAVLTDRRALFGTPREALPLLQAHRSDQTLSNLARLALVDSTPTGFDAAGALSLDGAHAEQLDIRAAAVAPIAAIGRWLGAAAGLSTGSTPERLRAAAAGGLIDPADAETLADAFAVAFELRVARQIEQLNAGEAPDDLLDLTSLSQFTRDQLRDVFRAVVGVQRRLRR